MHREAAGIGLAEVVDQEAADRDLGPDIGEDSNCAKQGVPVLPDAVGDAFFAGAEVAGGLDARQLKHGNRQAQQHQGQRDGQIRHLDRGRLVQAIGVQGVRSHGPDFLHGLGSGAQDQERADRGRNGGAQRIEGLRQIEPAGCSALRAQYRDIGIRRDLQHRDAGGEYDFRNQKERE